MRPLRALPHPATLDQIRVDIVAGLLDATLHHLTRAQIIAHLLVLAHPRHQRPPQRSRRDGHHENHHQPVPEP